MNVRRFRPGFLLLAAAVSAPGCATNPATGERQLSLISESQEIQMGRENDPLISAQMGLYPDDALQRYVAGLGAQIAARTERPTLPWTFRVIDDPVVNAFAVPGGFIYVTRGLMAYLSSEAQLVSVLGHEAGHVTARHSVNQMSRAQLAQIGLVVGTIVRPELAGLADVAGAGLQLLFLKYGRDDEREADELGVRYMRRVGYDAREMPGVFTLLDRVSQVEGGGRVPEWLSTHPAPENRRERIQQILASLPPDSLGSRIEKNAYLQRLDGLVYDDDPREGFFRGTEFLHPVLRFRMTFPEGWKTVNQKQGVVGISAQQDAIIQLTFAQQNTAESAARAFQQQEGVQSGTAGRGNINGLPAVSLPFRATTQSGVLEGQATFIEYDSKVYQLLAYGPQQRWGSYDAVARRAVQSFERLNDPSVLNLQPMRLAIVRLDRAMTPAQIVQRYGGPATAEEIALLNQVGVNESIAAGAYAKHVTGQRAR
jgi:predicted Zn-dependent protease